jgi:hypothetical protein
VYVQIVDHNGNNNGFLNYTSVPLNHLSIVYIWLHKQILPIIGTIAGITKTVKFVCLITSFQSVHELLNLYRAFHIGNW